MTLARCANCNRSGEFNAMFYCVQCHLAFCRGPCHAEFATGRWVHPKEPNNDTQQTPVVTADSNE